MFVVFVVVGTFDVAACVNCTMSLVSFGVVVVAAAVVAFAGDRDEVVVVVGAVVVGVGVVEVVVALAFFFILLYFSPAFVRFVFVFKCVFRAILFFFDFK